MIKTAYFAGGCFWCITPQFAELKGVISVTAGYCGGDEADPTYEDVKHQKTHHRETIKVEYDDTEVGYTDLLDLYIRSVDPLDGNGQYIDKGYSYTLAIYYTDENEKQLSSDAVKNLEESLGQTTFISIEEYKHFYDAEEYHQDYYKKNPEAYQKELVESGRIKV